jgi:signal transduction histidine kinase
LVDPVRVLLVDGDLADRDAVREALEAAISRFDLHCVGNLSDGLESLDRAGADVVLVSSHLEGTTGPAAVRALMERGPGTPVIVLSALDDETRTSELLQAGAQDTLTKGPFTEELLGRAIEHAIDRQRLIRIADERLHRLEATEASFRAVAHGADGIAVVVSGRVQWANPAAIELLGANLVGGGLPFEVRETGVTEVTLHRDTGALTVEAQAAQTEWEGEPATLITLRDVTGRHELAERVRKVQALSLVGRLAGGVAHDFNNILTGMLGNLDLLEEAVEGTEAQAQLNAVIEGAEQAARLTQRLLAFGQQQVVQPRPQELGRVIARVERWLRHLCGHEIDLKFALSEGLPPVLADPVELEQILFNLVGNARDAIDEDGSITIATRIERVDGIECVVLAVSDTGTGIPEDLRHQLFEPFVTTKEGSGGVGLGLPTVADIVERRGGRIAFDSELEQGTTFTVWLPATGEDGETSELSVKTESDEGEIVLVVDDDQAIRQLLRAALEASGYTVEVAPDGAEGLRLARALDGRLNLLVTDVMMPGMRGDDLAATLQAEQPTLKALLISGFAQSALNEGKALSDSTAFLGKPFRTGDLLRRVRGLLDR